MFMGTLQAGEINAVKSRESPKWASRGNFCIFPCGWVSGANRICRGIITCFICKGSTSITVLLLLHKLINEINEIGLLASSNTIMKISQNGYGSNPSWACMQH